MGLGLGFGYSGPWLQWTLAVADGNRNSLAATRGDSFASLNRDLRRVTARRAPRTRRPSCPGCARGARGFPPCTAFTAWPAHVRRACRRQGRYIFYAGASLAGAGYCQQCRRRPAILPLQLWQGCQVCVKISAQRLPRVAQFYDC